jgi:hypothetical protein
MTKHGFMMAALAALLVSGLEAANKAYIFTGTDQFGTIDLDTGAFRQLGNTGVLLCGIGVAQGAIYGGENRGNTLYQISPTDGSLTVAGISSITYYDMGSTTKGLYALDPSGNLYSVDAPSGATTLIGPTGVSFSGTVGMSTNSKTLFLTVAGSLYVLDTTTGAGTLVGSTGLGGIGALVFEGGKLYAGSNSPFQVDTLNTATGEGTFVSDPTGNPAPAVFWGLAPSILLNIAPDKLKFPRQTVGTSSEPLDVTLTNNGFVAMKVKSVEASGDFTQTNDCGASLPAKGSCTISVIFTPTETGRLTGSVKIVDTAGGSPQKISLSGTGK